MTPAFLSFRTVSFGYPSSTDPVFQDLDLDLPRGWTGVVGANGAGKTTLLLLAAGLLLPTVGAVRPPGEPLYCPQRTEEQPDGLVELMEAGDAEAGGLRSRLGLASDWPDRWETLSHGERKRAQIAVALWRGPALLCIDEPTNHVDASTRRLLVEGLLRFGGVGLLVSHDRELLDLLCARCLMLEPGSAVLRPGSYTEAAAQARAERESLNERWRRARGEERRLDHAAAEKRREASETKARLSKRGLARGDSAGREKIDRARLSGKDRTPGKAARELEGRRERVRESMAGMDARKDYELGLWFASEGARRDTLFSLPAGRLPMGESGALEVPELVMLPGDRVAVTGPNGCGKSTLIRHIVGRLTLPADRVIYLPQELAPEEERATAAAMRSLPPTQLGRTLTVVNLLGSNPKRILASGRLSPGELRKVQLAMGIARVPHLIIMDEPTNHLDLPSIECLTEALHACACGLLLVSHDSRFLKGLVNRTWELAPRGAGHAVLTMI
jgi:macrolide transport system ATP-binding/permease protein